MNLLIGKCLNPSLKICRQKVKLFKSQIALITVSPDCYFFSDIFPVPKKTEWEFRIICDLTDLIKHQKS